MFTCVYCAIIFEIMLSLCPSLAVVYWATSSQRMIDPYISARKPSVLHCSSCIWLSHKKCRQEPFRCNLFAYADTIFFGSLARETGQSLVNFTVLRGLGFFHLTCTSSFYVRSDLFSFLFSFALSFLDVLARYSFKSSAPVFFWIFWIFFLKWSTQYCPSKILRLVYPTNNPECRSSRCLWPREKQTTLVPSARCLWPWLQL